MFYIFNLAQFILYFTNTFYCLLQNDLSLLQNSFNPLVVAFISCTYPCLCLWPRPRPCLSQSPGPCPCSCSSVILPCLTQQTTFRTWTYTWNMNMDIDMNMDMDMVMNLDVGTDVDTDRSRRTWTWNLLGMLRKTKRVESANILWIKKALSVKTDSGTLINSADVIFTFLKYIEASFG